MTVQHTLADKAEWRWILFDTRSRCVPVTDNAAPIPSIYIDYTDADIRLTMYTSVDPGSLGNLGIPSCGQPPTYGNAVRDYRQLDPNLLPLVMPNEMTMRLDQRYPISP